MEEPSDEESFAIDYDSFHYDMIDHKTNTKVNKTLGLNYWTDSDGFIHDYFRDINIARMNRKRGGIMATILAPDNMYPPCIVSNVVSYICMDKAQNQIKVALYAKDKLPVYHDPKNFAFSQLPSFPNGYPPVKLLFFSGEKTTIVGGLSEDHNRLTAWNAIRYINDKFQENINLISFETKNIVANVDMPFKIDLDSIMRSKPGRARFKPVLINCCRVKSNHGDSMVYLIFHTGSILLIGAKNMEELRLLYLEACETAVKNRENGPTSDASSKKYNQKKRILSTEVIEATNQSIENAILNKRRKISKSSRSDANKKLSLEYFDQTMGIDKTALVTQAIKSYYGDLPQLEGPKFAPTCVRYQLTNGDK